jgi:2-isopropylmalate synthase
MGPGSLDLIYDWNEVERRGRLIPKGVTFFDETLRDGLQNPSVTDPSVAQKIELLHLMNDVGIHGANVGLPGSSARAKDDIIEVCRAIASSKLNLTVGCAGRTVVSDITPMLDVADRTGLPIEAFIFIGSSPIRQLAEDWDLSLIQKRSADAIDVAVKGGLSVCYITEDTTRSRPEVLRTLFQMAIDHGVARICLADTVGHATPDGVRNLVTFTKEIIERSGARVGIDWHGHNDRGLALENALWALEFGADRVHGTALGIGERVGNAAMELILLNLKLLGLLEDQDLTKLLSYCESAASALGWQVPINYPLVGHDAFRTATGVHAAAIIKAEAKGDAWLADRIYSGVPAGMFGRRQEICIGYMSGVSNVLYWLRQHGVPPVQGLADAILAQAKGSHRILTDDEVLSIAKAFPGPPRA